MVAAEEMFSIETLTSFTQVFYFVSVEETVMDCRRFTSVIPTVDTVAAALAAVTTPSGVAYTFITDLTVITADLDALLSAPQLFTLSVADSFQVCKL